MPEDACQVPCIGPGIAQRLKTRLTKHVKDGGSPLDVWGGQEPDWSLYEPPEKPTTTAAKRKRAAPASDKAITNGTVVPENSLESGAKKTGKIRATTTKSGASKTYVPQIHSGSYAVLLALLRNSMIPGSMGHLSKGELILAAQPLSHSSFTVPPSHNSATSATAWTSVGTLITKGLVFKTGNPARYSLTPDGEELAKAMQNKIDNDGAGTAQSVDRNVTKDKERFEMDKENLDDRDDLSATTHRSAKVSMDRMSRSYARSSSATLPEYPTTKESTASSFNSLSHNGNPKKTADQVVEILSSSEDEEQRHMIASSQPLPITNTSDSFARTRPQVSTTRNRHLYDDDDDDDDGILGYQYDKKQRHEIRDDNIADPLSEKPFEFWYCSQTDEKIRIKDDAAMKIKSKKYFGGFFFFFHFIQWMQRNQNSNWNVCTDLLNPLLVHRNKPSWVKDRN